MEFRLLGPLEVRHSGEILPVRAPRQRSLLAALLLHANQVVTVDRLIDRVWGQDPPPSAAANLRTHVAALRRNLSGAKGSARVVARSGGYLIVVRPGELDLSAFEELASQGRAAVQRSEHALAARRFGEALALWHGRPLENVALSGTAEADAVRLSEDRISVLEDCLHARLSCRRARQRDRCPARPGPGAPLTRTPVGAAHARAVPRGPQSGRTGRLRRRARPARRPARPRSRHGAVPAPPAHPHRRPSPQRTETGAGSTPAPWQPPIAGPPRGRPALR